MEMRNEGMGVFWRNEGRVLGMVLCRESFSKETNIGIVLSSYEDGLEGQSYMKP